MKGSKSIVSKLLMGNSSRGFRATQADIQAKAQAERKIAEIRAQEHVTVFEEEDDYDDYIQEEVFDFFDGPEHRMKLKKQILQEFEEKEAAKKAQDAKAEGKGHSD